MLARLVALLALALSSCGADPTTPPAAVPRLPAAATAPVPLTTASADTGPAAPPPTATKLDERVRDAVVVGERIYLLGDSNAVHIYDPKTDTWSRGANSGGDGTAADHLFVAHDGQIFSFPHTWGPIESAAYDVNANKWADLDTLPGLNDKQGDHVFAAEVVEGALYIAAQKSRPGLRSTLVFRYDELSRGWVKAP